MSRVWTCEDCKVKGKWTYNQLATQGIPVCPRCDKEMVLIPKEAPSGK